MPDFATAESAGVDAIYTAMGLSVTYTLVGGGASTVRVIAPWQDRPENLGYDTRSPERGKLMSVRISEVASPARGDTVTIAAGAHAGDWLVGRVESNDGIEAVLVVH